MLKKVQLSEKWTVKERLWNSRGSQEMAVMVG